MIYDIRRTSDGGNASVSVFVDGELLCTDSSNPRFDDIVEFVVNYDEDAYEDDTYYLDDMDWFRGLFDLETVVAGKLSAANTDAEGNVVSERVTIRAGKVYVDNDPIDGSLTDRIVRFLDEGVDDWKPLVRFLENIVNNPNGHSRTQLYSWLERHDFSLSDDGCFYAYKGLDNKLRSIHAGPGVVNGVSVNGQLDNSVGNVVELPRSDVHHDPSVGCSTGLHAGTYSYASTFGYGTTVRVKINPRDVVSVPTDCDWQKIRCCRYEVVEVVSEESNPLVYAPADSDWTESDW